LVIAPATANVLAKLAHGIADDFLTTLSLATKAPILVAPAMNVNMWDHPATQENLVVLRARGVRVVDPDEGALACGMTGPGRLASVESIAQAVFDLLGLRDDLKDETVLVTAGRTEEAWDAVRYLSNRSSGKMGYALVRSARRRGARVILISGPADREPPQGVLLERVRNAQEMCLAVLQHLDEASVVVMAAAVSDFRPADGQPQKIKKVEGLATLRLEPTPDILSEIALRRREDQLITGFAAETDHVLENAFSKLRTKRLDLIVANDVTLEGAGFEVNTNIVTLLWPDGRQKPLGKMDKQDVADRVLDEVVELRKARGHAEVAREKPAHAGTRK
jgi:phosphopantothenoylcysteine decarboxylase/phosphopantothenate--cysteine ligase